LKGLSIALHWRLTFGCSDENAMSKTAIKRGIPAMHPGELLREEVFPAVGKPIVEIASLMGVSRQTHL
jgi:hypothetical protein